MCRIILPNHPQNLDCLYSYSNTSHSQTSQLRADVEHELPARA